MAPVVLLCIVSGVGLVILGTALGWPLWVWLLIPTVAVGILLLVTIRSEQEPKVDAWSAETPAFVPESPVDAPYQETRLQNVSLPSSMTDYNFLFSATVWWRPEWEVGSRSFPTDLTGKAHDWVLSRARTVTAQEHPGRCDLVQHRLNGALGVAMRDDSGFVTALATHVTITVPEADREHLEKLTALSKWEDVWERQCHHERRKRAYIGDDVLKSPGSAVVWWMARHDEKITEAVDMIGPLAQLSAAANDMEVPEPFQPFVAQAFAGYVPDLSECDSVEQADLMEEARSLPIPEPRVAEQDGIVDSIVQLLKELGFTEGSDDWKVYVHRIAGSTEAAGHQAAADRIRRDLLGESPSGGEKVVSQPRPNPEPGAADTGFHVGKDPDTGRENPMSEARQRAYPGWSGSAWAVPPAVAEPNVNEPESDTETSVG
ncbi:hypothetical protein [Streptomyces sp. NPDC088725]|uniref:hypothetical protein n=1 Tax=Streptomyces sp. NPDC088725 TaxID=3365873 RepID=UPI0037F15134